MGAFETFVNANLGIRKPLISDAGHPSGSLQAAGIIGSQYIDSSTNELYEKTGENNILDWKFIRVLGSAPTSTGIVTTNELQVASGELDLKIQQTGLSLNNQISGVQSQISNAENQTLSYSFSIPSGAYREAISFNSLGNTVNYSSAPTVVTSMRFNSLPEYIYSHVNYNITNTGFYVAFTDEIDSNDAFLDIIINSESSNIS